MNKDLHITRLEKSMERFLKTIECQNRFICLLCVVNIFNVVVFMLYKHGVIS